MFIYSIRRLNLFIVTLLILTTITYNIVLLNPNVGYHHYSGFTGWLHYLSQLLQGNWGLTNTEVPALSAVAHVLPATLELCLVAFLIALLVGIPLGTIAGIKRGHFADIMISSVTLFTFSIPVFWLAILMIMFFSHYLGILPVSGRFDLLFKIPTVTGFSLVDIFISDHPQKELIFKNAILHFLMPTLVLAVAPTTEIIKLLRDSVSDVMTQNYIKVAHTKGLSKTEIVMRHVLKNALPPIIPKFGIQISTMMTFAIITESIFNWPGIGTWLLDALNNQDYNAVQAGVLAVGCIVLVANILADLTGSAISPLTRKEWYAFR